MHWAHFYLRHTCTTVAQVSITNELKEEFMRAKKMDPMCAMQAKSSHYVPQSMSTLHNYI